MRVIKRDGRQVAFDKNKIIEAIQSAFLEVDKEVSDFSFSIANNIADFIEKRDCDMSVEEIQDIVENKLMTSRRKDVAKAYIVYREKRNIGRERKSELINTVAEKLKASNVQNQNANVDEASFGGRMGEANSALMRKYALDYCLSDMAKNNHLNNEVYIHDLDHYAVGDHNCLSIPFDDLLANGFKTRQTDVRPAGSASTAFQLVAVLFQLQSLQQFGGVSATHLDWTMVPYVRKSFAKHYKDGLRFISEIEEQDIDYEIEGMLKDAKEYSIEDSEWSAYNDKAYEYAKAMTEKEVQQAVEGMYHNLNTLQSRSGNQLPFTSINYGTCTLPEGRMVIKALLQGSIDGVGKLHKTSIFPCGIFQCMKGVNRKQGDPNYDLFQLALESTAKRLYPNYANCDWSVNEGYDKNDPKTYVSTMGALAGHEHLYVKIENDTYDMSIKDFFEYCKNGEIKNARPCNVYFNKSRTLLKGNKTKQEKSHIKVGSGVYKITYLPEDVSYIGASANVNRRLTEHRSAIRLTGGLDCGVCFGDTDITHYKFEILEYCDNWQEKEEKYIESIPNVNFKGVSQTYYKCTKSRKDIIERPHFLQDKTIPQDLIDLQDKDVKVLDRDNKWVKIKHIFKNDKRNSPFMMHITYEEDDNLYCLSCTEDHPLWNGTNFVKADKLLAGDKIYRADGKELTIIKITWHWEPVDSYDIGTETGSFIGSDIIMHNCRTYNGYDINGMGFTKDGRGNIAPVTIIMPTLAMETEGNIENFMSLLDIKIHEAKDMLIERFNWICSQSPEAAKFMYENGVMAGYVPEEGIYSALKHGTLVIGQLGLAETLQILIGCDHTTNEGMELAKRIEELFNKRCKEFKESYHLNFGVYYTPAENLCYTAMKKFKARYGEIPNVSDREYFTNSMHIPVWKKMTAYEKISTEAQLTGYSNAGCITYVEFDTAALQNIEALEKIVNFALDNDIPYFAINVPNDTCLSCGYMGVFNDKCPMCGSGNIQQLRRVTGYLTTDYHNFNKGKQAEVKDRIKHSEYTKFE